MPFPAVLALEDGSLFEGTAFGHHHMAVHAVGEVVFNTAMTGYQEILTDPSYAGQIIALTYPHIGNVGINQEDCESNVAYAKGLIIRQLPNQISNWRSQTSLEQFLAQNHIVGIAEIDTRKLTRLIREKGALKGCIYTSPILSEEAKREAIDKACAFSGLKGLDLANEVTTSSSYHWQEGGLWSDKKSALLEEPFKVVAYDFGIKKNILRCLFSLGCQITVVPAKTKAQEVLEVSPDGIFLSNGPGDPDPCDYAIEAIKLFLQRDIPLFGICLGHQLLAQAMGAKTRKMKFGHHGANHPVRSLIDNKVWITSQNHGFTVEESSIPACMEITHRSLFDHTIQGFKHRIKPAFGFQGHPEAGPGPHDARSLFMKFIHDMGMYRKQKKKLLERVLEMN